MTITSRAEQFLDSGGHPGAEISAEGRASRAGSRPDRGAPLAPLRLAVAVYGGFCSIPVGMAVATWV